MGTIEVVLGWVIVAVLAGVGVLFSRGLGRLSWGAQHVRHRHRAVKRWPIGEAPENELARLRGHARVHERSLIAPLSGRRCVYYAVAIEGRRKFITECDSVPFVLEDASGRAIIEPGANGAVALTFDHREKSPVFSRPRREMELLLGRHGIASRGLFGTEPLKFFEGVVEVGQEVELVGTGIRQPERELRTEAGYRTPLPTSLHVTDSVQAPLSISTVIHDA